MRDGKGWLRRKAAEELRRISNARRRPALPKAEQAALELRVLRLRREGKTCNACTVLKTCVYDSAGKVTHALRQGVCADFDNDGPSVYVGDHGDPLTLRRSY